MKRIIINWKGETVGFMEDPKPDMWYLEGKWLPNDSPCTADFLEITRNLDARQSIDSGSNVWVELIEESGGMTRATVLSCPGETIFVRRSLPTDSNRKWYQFWKS